MNKIITIGREFGSGGRELGRRLATELKIEYYDKEILAEILKQTPFTEQYIREASEHIPHPFWYKGHSACHCRYSLKKQESMEP